MESIIQDQKRICTVSGTLGLVKLTGNVTMDATAPKVLNFNLTVHVNTAKPTEPEAFIWAGNVNKDAAFNMNLQPEYSDMAQAVTEVVFALIANVELQYTSK